MPASDDDLRVSRVAALTLSNALIFQQILSHKDTRIEPVSRTLAQRDVAKALEKCWALIETIDYVPIFDLALQLIRELHGTPDLDKALKELGNAALSITSRRAALRHDLMGRIYHLLLRDAKYFGAYYTSVPTAALLLRLTLDPKASSLDWSDEDELGKLRIADLACGTGTLLKASLQTVEDNYVRARSEKNLPLDLAALHSRFIEDSLWGLDVIPFAIHLAASALAMHEPNALFGRMHLYTLPLSGTGKHPKLGSLEIVTHKVHPQADLFGSPTGPWRTTASGDVSEVLELPKLDLCVMNPPFTRSVGGNLLFGNMPPKQRQRMQAELKKLVKKGELFASITAGLGSVFVALGDRFVKPGGHLALVLPRAVLSGVAWKQTRKLLAAYYHVRYIVVSHEAGNWSFSENTDLSECLLVARRRVLREEPGETKVINLWRRPGSVIEALGVAQLAIGATGVALEGSTGVEEMKLSLDGRKIGEVVLCPAKRIGATDWMREAAFAQTDLSRVAHHLREGRVYLPGRGPVATVALVPLGTLGVPGPDRRDIHDGFALTTSKTAYAALWGHDTDSMSSLALAPNKHLSPLPTAKKGRPARNHVLLWSRAGRLVIAERMRLNLLRIAAARVSEDVLSNTWWPVRTRAVGEASRDEIEKILCLWLNSTLGLISLMASRVDTEGPWIEIKKPMLKALRVLDVSRMPKEDRRHLVATYDANATTALQPIPDLEKDPVRARIDGGFASVLRLGGDLAVLRRLVAAEPLLRV